MSVELADLKKRVADFCEARDWDQFHDIKELAIGVSTESAELLEIFRFQSKQSCEAMFADNTQREKIEDELADVFFFLLRISGRYSVDLNQALVKKMQKNAVKYPVDKARGNNQKYDKL
jgi:NTP pyrophosphatase (non-canonical NTP hydrolase)